MEFKGLYKKMRSDIAGGDVTILKYESKEKYPYCDCSRCGKPIKKIMYVVQDDKTDVEMFYLGSECIKHFS